MERFDDSIRVFSTGYGTEAAMLQLAPGADGQFTVRELWRTNRMKNPVNGRT
ncbi:MAG: hypothetical protein H0X67_09630 [Acidobacteria bacterium]|nr:hypothetical protein [Acidobacteriota bacterium]